MTKLLKTEKECIEYIHSAGRFGKKAGLCNIKALLCVLGNPHKKLRCIHVAGTNGKGSACSMLRSILTSAGYRVGMNTSPYIEEFAERLTIDGTNIPADKLICYTNRVKDAIGSMGGVHPIEFEIITAIGFLYFYDEGCDYVVLECGLGGLYDSTNVIETPVLNLICRIGLDHTEILGETLEEIAFQKAGTIKEGSRVVLHSHTDDVSLRVIKGVANEKNAELFIPEYSFEIISQTMAETVIRIEDCNIRIPLLGEHQIYNALLAIKSAELMGIDMDFIKEGIENTRWKCRFELVREGIIIDGAHNHQGICAFADSVKRYIPEENRICLIGMLNDKDFDSSAKELSALKARFVVTDVPSMRQTRGIDVYQRILKYIPHAVYEPDYKKACDMALSMAEDTGFVCIAGSLYLAGALRIYLRDNK